MSLPILFKINGKHLLQIMLTSAELTALETAMGKTFANWTDEEILQNSIEQGVQPTEVKNTAEQYSRNTERSANYVLSDVTIVNCKAKPEFTWSLIKADYVKRLLTELSFNYNYELSGQVYPVVAQPISVTYWDFIGLRTINTYMGQTLEGTLVQYTQNNTAILYWENFRVAFPER